MRSKTAGLLMKLGGLIALLFVIFAVIVLTKGAPGAFVLGLIAACCTLALAYAFAKVVERQEAQMQAMRELLDVLRKEEKPKS